MGIVKIECDEKIVVMKLNRGTTNAINLELIDELSGSLRKIEDDSEVTGVVLTSTNDKFFSIGLDIPWLYHLSKDEFKKFYHAFNGLCLDLYTFSKPTMAAVTGHAVAGGCILALCCDYRYIAEGRKLMGLNEIKLGVPLPYPADCILRDLVGTRIAREMVETGNFMESEKLYGLGIVDRVLPQKDVLSGTIEKIKTLGSFSSRGFGMIKRNRVIPVKEKILKHLGEREKYFIECWYSEETRELLKEAMEKF